MREVTLGEIAQIVGGELRGDPSLKIRRIMGIEEAEEGDLTFLASERHLEALRGSKASAALVPKGVDVPMAQVVVRDPYRAVVRLLREFYPRRNPPPGISEWAWISPEAKVGRDVSIGPFVYVGDGAEIGDRVVLYPGVYVGPGVRIGEDSVLYPNVVLYEGTVIGRRVVVHAGTVIGADGFGYLREGDKIVKIPQVGRVEIGDDVEIGANCCIDRATLGTTRIGAGTKVDNLVQVGHNVWLGENCIVVAQVGIGGSTRVGRGVVLAGQVGIADHVRIGDGAMVSAKAGIFRDVAPGEQVGGIPQMPHRRWMRVVAEISRLPELRRELEELKERLRKMEEGS